jgi:pyruvate dehydrogenase E2 component (dihydrolipoyllysine-residue acetyltransferase)
MPTKILMPALSPTMTEGNLARWLKREGDSVQAGDAIAEIETDKATMEVEAVDDGTLGRIVVPEGAEAVKVNEIIGWLLEEGEDASALAAAPAEPAEPAPQTEPQPAPPAAPEAAPPAAPEAGSEGAPAATPLARRIAAQAGLDLAAVPATGAHGKRMKADVERVLQGAAGAPPAAAGDGARVFASPLARRMAAQAGLDLASIAGSGPEGRIVKSDIEAALAAAATARDGAPPPAPIAAPAPGDEVVRLSTMRRVIAERMTVAKQTVPHFYLTVDCEIDDLLATRKRLNAEDDELRVSVNDFIVRAVALALRKVPRANVSWEGEGMMRHHGAVDIAVAVALDDGLVTPILRDADQKGLAALSREMKDLAARARTGKLKPEEYQGGGFTISNLGMFGVRQFDAVINPPQACILAVGAGEQRAVVRDGALAIASVMSCTLSVDHRVVDGAIGARLLGVIKRYLEFPSLMLL